MPWCYRVITAVSLAAAVCLSPAALGAVAQPSSGANGGVVVLDARTGHERWRVITPRQDHFYAAPGAEITVATKATCLGDDSGLQGARLVAFDAPSGRRRWSAPDVSSVTRPPGVPVDAGGVIVTPGGRGPTMIVGLDAETGKRRWMLPASESLLGASATLVFTSSARFGNPGAVLHAFDRRTGALRWSFGGGPEWRTTFDAVKADADTVVVANGLYNSRQGDHPLSPTTFYVLDARQGTERTRFVVADPAFPFWTGLALTRTTLVHYEDAKIVSRSLSDGTVQWERQFAPVALDQRIGGFFPVTATASSDDRTMFVVSSGDAKVFAIDSRTGKTRWDAPSSTNIEASSDGITIVGDFKQRKVRALSTVTGKAAWTYALPAGLASGPAATGINVGYVDGMLTMSTVCDEG